MNIEPKFVQLAAFKAGTEVNDGQVLNMLDMFVAAEVSNSGIVCNAVQPLNVLEKFAQALVFHRLPLGVGSVCNAVQPLNVEDIVVTPEVFMDATAVKLVQVLNVNERSEHRAVMPFVACPSAEVSDRLAQRRNVWLIPVILLKSQEGTAARDRQSENVFVTLVSAEVEAVGMLVNKAHPLNIEFAIVTEDKSNAGTEAKVEHPLNIDCVFVTEDVLNRETDLIAASALNIEATELSDDVV